MAAMSACDEKHCEVNKAESVSALDQFLRSVAEKNADPIQERLLRAYRKSDPSGSLEAELQAIVSEILNEA